MRAVLTVIGHDKKGIIAKVSGYLAEVSVNIEDISQTVLRDYFVMIMLVDTSKSKLKIAEMSAQLENIAKEKNIMLKLNSQSCP